MKIKTTAFLLCLLMITSLLAACAGSDEQKTDTTAAAETKTPDGGDSLYDADGYLRDNLPDDLDFGGREIGVLYWSDVEKPEFEVEAITGDIVDDAIWHRNRAVEERLGVQLKWYSTPGNNGNRANFLKYVQNSYNAGEQAYDIIPTYSRSAGMLVVNNLVADLLELDYLDLEMPWWPESLKKCVEINNKMFFVSGDASTNLLHIMYGMYFNKDLFTNYNLPDPQEIAAEGNWTLDKLIEFTSGIHEDLNNNSRPDKEDLYGFVTIYYHNDAFYTGSGLRLVETDPVEILKISSDFYSEKANALVDKISSWQRGESVYAASDYQDTFVNGNALICANRMYMADKFLRDVPFSYGVLPTPKYDENQEDYISVVGNPVTLYCVARDSKNMDAVGAVLECWGSEAYRRTTPALFEVNMQVKYSENEINSQMFDIIKRTIDFDLGRIFSQDLQYMSEIPSNTILNGQSWATTSVKYTGLLDKGIKTVIDAILKY